MLLKAALAESLRDLFPSINELLPRWRSSVEEELSQPLRRVAILSCVFGIARQYRWLILLGVFSSGVRTVVSIFYDWPGGYLADTIDTNERHLTDAQFHTCIVTFVVLWIVIRWTHDRLLTFWHDGIRVKVDAYIRRVLSIYAIDSLQDPDVHVEENMQSSVQSSREQLPAIILAVMSDSPKYVLSVGFFGYFLYLAPSAPIFSLVSIVGLCVSAAITWGTGGLSGDFDAKQAALDQFQREENDVHEHIRRSKSEILFIFKNWIWSGPKADMDQLQTALDAYTKACIKAGILLLRKTQLRDFAFDATQFASMAVAAWYAHAGIFSYGDLIILFGYVGRTADGIKALSDLQILLLNGQYFTEWYTKMTTSVK